MTKRLDPAPFGGTPRNPFRPVCLESVSYQFTALFGAHTGILIRQSLYGVTTAQGHSDRMKLRGLELVHLIVGRPA